MAKWYWRSAPWELVVAVIDQINLVPSSLIHYGSSCRQRERFWKYCELYLDFCGKKISLRLVVSLNSEHRVCVSLHCPLGVTIWFNQGLRIDRCQTIVSPYLPFSKWPREQVSHWYWRLKRLLMLLKVLPFCLPRFRSCKPVLCGSYHWPIPRRWFFCCLCSLSDCLCWFRIFFLCFVYSFWHFNISLGEEEDLFNLLSVLWGSLWSWLGVEFDLLRVRSVARVRVELGSGLK